MLDVNGIHVRHRECRGGALGALGPTASGFFNVSFYLYPPLLFNLDVRGIRRKILSGACAECARGGRGGPRGCLGHRVKRLRK